MSVRDRFGVGRWGAVAGIGGACRWRADTGRRAYPGCPGTSTVDAAASSSPLSWGLPGPDRDGDRGRDRAGDNARGHGFVRDDSGYRPVDVRGTSFTAAQGQNNAGHVVGGYIDGHGRIHGFVQREGRVKTLDVPRARGTVASKINDDGAIVGFYTDRSGTPAAQAEHGFLYDGDRFRRIDVPGATETRPAGINDRGQIVGEHVDGAGVSHGFVRGPTAA